jgi:hypothetical protein
VSEVSVCEVLVCMDDGGLKGQGMGREKKKKEKRKRKGMETRDDIFSTE